MQDLHRETRARLYEMCKSRGMTGCSRLKKPALIAALSLSSTPSFVITFGSGADAPSKTVSTFEGAVEAIYTHLDEDRFEYTDSYDLGALAAYMRSALVGGERAPMRHFYDNAKQSLTYRGVLGVEDEHIARLSAENVGCCNDAAHAVEMWLRRVA
jgi:hypothetical protein